MNTQALSFLSVLFLSLSSIIAQPEDGLIAYYAFDQTSVENEVDFYSDGKVKGAAKWVKGVKGLALHFDGRPDEVLFEERVNEYLSADREFSLSFYFRSADLQQMRSLMGKRSQCNSFHHFDIKVGRRLSVELSERKSPLVQCRVAVDIPDQRWHHYVIIREQNGLRLYMDGRLVMTRRTAYPVYIKDEVPFGINVSPCKNGNQMKDLAGSLDELRIYRHALYTEEIRGLYRSLDQNQRQSNTTRPRNKVKPSSDIAKIFGTYRSSGSNNRAQLQLNPQEFVLVINQPESDQKTDQLTFSGRYKIKAGQLLLEKGTLKLSTAGIIKERPYEGPKIIGDIYGENITIDLLAFETRLKMVKRE